MTKSMLHIFGAALALMLAACGQSGTYYEKSPEEVTSSLRSATPPLALMGRSVNDSRVFEEDGNIITAITNNNGKDVLHIVTTISPEGTGSVVSNSILVPADMADQNADFAMMQVMADEHVTAAINGRAFNMMAGSSPMARAAIANVPGGNETIDAANEAMAAFSEMEREMAQAEREEEFRNEYGEDWGADVSP